MADFQKEHESMDGKDENMDGKDENMGGKYNDLDGNVNSVLHRVVFTVQYAIDVSNRAIHLLSYLISALLYVWLFGIHYLAFVTYSPLCLGPTLHHTRNSEYLVLPSAVGALKHKPTNE